MCLRGPLARFLTMGHLRDCANVLLGCAAAAADKVQPAVIREFLELRRKRSWRLQILALFVRQAGVGIARDELACKLAQGADMVGHEFRPSGAVHAKSQRLCKLQRRPHCLNGLAGKH